MTDWYKLGAIASGGAIVALTAHGLYKYYQDKEIPGAYSVAIPAATGIMFLAPRKQREETTEYWTG